MAMKTAKVVEEVATITVVNLEESQWRSQYPSLRVQGTYSSFLTQVCAAPFTQVFAPCP